MGQSKKRRRRRRRRRRNRRRRRWRRRRWRRRRWRRRRSRRRGTCEFIAFSFHHTSKLDKFSLALLLNFRVVEVLVAKWLHSVEGESKLSDDERKKTRGKIETAVGGGRRKWRATRCTEVDGNNFC